jgi:hypothetical protein
MKNRIKDINRFFSSVIQLKKFVTQFTHSDKRRGHYPLIKHGSQISSSMDRRFSFSCLKCEGVRPVTFLN